MRALILGAVIAGGIIGSAAAQDGPDRPRGRLFISPMGEPFRGGPDKAAPQDQWFDGADANHDGALTAEELNADAARFFVLLDVRKDGEIDPDDVERYETILVPEIRVGGAMRGRDGGEMRGGRSGGGRGRGGRGRGQVGEDGPGGPAEGGRRPSFGGGQRQTGGKQGAGRFGYLDYPQPITVADRNFNRGVDAQEWAKAAETRFGMLDKNGDGRIEKSELPKLAQGPGGGGPRDGREPIPKD